MLNNTNTPTETTRRRWPGVVLSIIVPGFGHIRAGAWRRGVLWMFGLYAAALACMALFVFPGIPLAIGLAACVAEVLLFIVMLCDSFRPGRMTWRLWILWVALIAGSMCLPNPHEWLGMTFVIPSDGMAPTIIKGDYLAAERLSYRFQKPKRGDVIVFFGAGIPALNNKGNYFVQRLVGLPGDLITIEKGWLFLNGKRLTEKGAIQKDGDSFVVGDDEYFVLGDNSAHSFDSRYWGGMPASNLFGKATKIYFPFRRMGSVR